MRLWMCDGGLMTDEQVLAYIGQFGSLSEALSHGDIRLVADGSSQPRYAADGVEFERESSRQGAEKARAARPSLADYLHENYLQQRETSHERANAFWTLFGGMFVVAIARRGGQEASASVRWFFSIGGDFSGLEQFNRVETCLTWGEK